MSLSGLRGACLTLVLLAPACGGVDDARQTRIVDTLVASDRHWMRTRAELVADKYRLMSDSVVAFYRGTVPLWAADWADPSSGLARTAFPAPSVTPWSAGDAHPENFGVLLGPDGVLGLEPNDLDAADRYPYLWDVRRLAVGMCVGARTSNAEDPDRRAEAVAACPEIAASAARGYVDGLAAAADGTPVGRVTGDGGSDILEDVFTRAGERLEEHGELQQLRTFDFDAKAWRLVRGAFDAEDPGDRLLDLPAYAVEALEETLSGYRESLPAPPPLDFFTVLDAARLLGSGVASQPRIRALILLRGPTDDAADDVIVELKELGESGAAGWLPPGASVDDVFGRIREAQRRLWTARDAEPLWGTATWLGLPVQLRRELDAHVTIRARRWEKSRGSVDDLVALARQLGRLLGRAHGRDAEALEGLAGVRADPDGFAAEQGRLADRVSAQVARDWELFKAALAERGPLLGVRVESLEGTGVDDPAPVGLDALVFGMDTESR